VLDRRDFLTTLAFTGACSAWSLPVQAASIHSLKPTRGDRLMLPVLVNGHPVDALLDSAAEASFVH